MAALSPPPSPARLWRDTWLGLGLAVLLLPVGLGVFIGAATLGRTLFHALRGLGLERSAAA